MSENQEEILANFQSITAIDDVGEAILILENSNWDLLTAVHRVLPPDNDQENYASFNPPPLVSNRPSGGGGAALVFDHGFNDLNSAPSPDVVMNEPSSPVVNRNIYGPEGLPGTLAEPNSEIQSADRRFFNINSSSSSSSSSNSRGGSSSGTHDCLSKATTNGKDLAFHIYHQNTSHIILLSKKNTVGDLKAQIMEKTLMPICRQELSGWPENVGDLSNSTPLGQLRIEQENELILNDFDAEENDLSARLGTSYTLNIKREPEGVEISLKFPGKQTLLEVKTDVYSITDIPVRHQNWTGWPNSITGDTALADSGINLVHDFILKSNAPSASERQQQSANVIEIDSSDSSEFEDATEFFSEEDFSTELPARNRLNYLIPNEIGNERIGSQTFVENYIQRYGEPHPEFFIGSLEEALNEACHKPAKDRKLLAIYLHHDGSVLTNVFCDQLLKCETVMQTLQHNFILYGWDLTYESNKNMFLSSILACGGMTASMTVRNAQLHQLPAILVIGKTRSICEVLAMIHGNVSKDELMSKLIDTINMYSDQRDVEVREENDRAAREQVKMEQDVAYNESLEADRRKEEAKRQKEHAILSERRRLESERQEIEAIREANRLDAEQCVPPEPIMGAAGVTKIRVRMPTGEFFERRFFIDNTLLHLLKFIASKGFPADEYKVISSYPRRDLTTTDSNETLGHYKLCPQETVILEER